MGLSQATLLWFFMFWTHSILNLSLLWALIQINPLLQATARTLGKKEVQFWWVTANPGKWEQHRTFFSHDRQMFSFLSERIVNQLKYQQANCTAPKQQQTATKTSNKTEQPNGEGVLLRMLEALNKGRAVKIKPASTPLLIFLFALSTFYSSSRSTRAASFSG